MQSTGKYKARLFDAVRFQTPKGKDAVSFVWSLHGLGQRITSTLEMLDPQGHLDAMAIYNTRQWAQGWDGRDLGWFANNLATLQQRDVYLSVTQGVVDWVLPCRPADPPAPKPQPLAAPKQETSEHTPPATSLMVIKLVVDRKFLQRLPDSIEPSAVNAKTLFDALTVETERDDAAVVWAMMASEIGPMQIDFTPEQWQQMIDKIRNLESKTFSITERL